MILAKKLIEAPVVLARQGLLSTFEWRFSENPVPYLEAIAFLEHRVEAVKNQGAPPLIWILEHPHIYTQGTSGDRADILAPVKNFEGNFTVCLGSASEKICVPLQKIGRGGRLTYHGPGQGIVYVVFHSGFLA